MMIKFLMIFCLICSVASGKQLNEKYSYKDFTNQSLKTVPVEELNNTIIKGSCFYQEWKEGDTNISKRIFPNDMKGVTFLRCNIDNVFLPSGNTANDTNTKKKIKVQNDLGDWILDASGKAIEPINKEAYLDLGLSINPKYISKIKLNKSVVSSKEGVMNESL